VNAKHEHYCGDAPAVFWWTLVVGFSLAASSARADTNVVVVQAEIVTNQFEAYAQVEPIAVLPVRVAQAGIVVGLEIVPGAAVQTGQKLAGLGGPEIQALLAQDEAAVGSAQTNLLAAQKSLAIERQQLASHLVTHQTILQAETAAAQAKSAFDAAQAQLRALQQTITLKAPADGQPATGNQRRLFLWTVISSRRTGQI
jgi:hypothetical protein